MFHADYPQTSHCSESFRHYPYPISSDDHVLLDLSPFSFPHRPQPTPLTVHQSPNTSPKIHNPNHMPVPSPKAIQTAKYARYLQSRMSNFPNHNNGTIGGGFSGGQKWQKATFPDEAAAATETYINSEGGLTVEEDLTATATLETTVGGVSSVPYPLHCRPVCRSEGSQSTSRQHSRSSSRNSTAASSGSENVDPFDDLDTTGIEGYGFECESDGLPYLHLREPSSEQQNGSTHPVSDALPPRWTDGSTIPTPIPGPFHAYRPPFPSTSGIPILPSSQAGYPSPCLEPLGADETGESGSACMSCSSGPDPADFGFGGMDSAAGYAGWGLWGR